ncbi:MAG TPA: Kazal-type serine protease inhibitor [Candidatus Polarisedimenticolaceae bacterium]|nr:Kazal-type serine protease inhibitor [Candidatus Polarisedimenticolaceae bacterium]
MKMLKRFVAAGFVAALLVSAAVGVMTLVSSPAEAGRCLCPKIYAPVVCDNGKTYANQCLADCRNAEGCVPTGGI